VSRYRYIGNRIALALLAVWLVSAALFIVMRMLPGDPVLLQRGLAATPESIAEGRRALGLDDPLPVQYVRWASAVVRLDFGRSLDGGSAARDLRDRLPVTLELTLLAIVWTCVFGVTAGIIAAQRRDRRSDYALRIGTSVALSIPPFWLATLVLALPQQWWGYAPPLDGARALLDAPATNLRQFVPASLVLAAASSAAVLRLTRASILATISADFVRTAHAKGLAPGTILRRHVLRISILPVLALLGIQAGGLLGGAVVVETIFNLNGVGQYFYRAILEKDFAVAQTVVLYTAAAVIGINLTVDIFSVLLDPRTRGA